MPEQQFKPEVAAALATMQTSHKQRTVLQYSVKKNLFNNFTFAVIEESFEKQSEDFLEILRKKVIENGGHVVSGSAKSHYVIFEDGYDQEVWRHNSVR